MHTPLATCMHAGVTAVIGNIFTGAMAPDPKTQLNGLGYDDQVRVLWNTWENKTEG